MKKESLFIQTLFGGLLLLFSGCDVVQSARNDLNRLTTSSPPTSSRPVQPAPRTTIASTQTASAAARSTPATPAKPDPKTDPPRESDPPPSISLIGKSESELRELLGPPRTVEERAPGRTWRYQDGRCTLDIQLYPDVQTRQFGTLAYEVKSDDNTDEGNRACMAQLRSRARSRG
jgi:hypothetical protein